MAGRLHVEIHHFRYANLQARTTEMLCQHKNQNKGKTEVHVTEQETPSIVTQF